MPQATDTEMIRVVEAFIYRETFLADENRYEDWEQLWADDGTYWVPLLPHDDPYSDTSIVFDNRRRIGIRVRQLVEGRRPTQTPKSRIRLPFPPLHSLSPLPTPSPSPSPEFRRRPCMCCSRL